MIFRDVIPKIIPKRRVLTEKIKPSFMNVEYMLENLLSDCEIHLITETGNVFFYVKNNVVILELQKRKLGDIILLNPTSSYYDIKSEPYRYKSYIRRALQIFFNIDDNYVGRIHIDTPSRYKHILNHGRLLNLE